MSVKPERVRAWRQLRTGTADAEKNPETEFEESASSRRTPIDIHRYIFAVKSRQLANNQNAVRKRKEISVTVNVKCLEFG